jgi:hypothetical protein
MTHWAVETITLVGLCLYRFAHVFDPLDRSGDLIAAAGGVWSSREPAGYRHWIGDLPGGAATHRSRLAIEAFGL